MDLTKIVTKARLTYVLGLIATSIVAKFNAAKTYADGLVDALTAGDIAFTNAAFDSNTDNVAKALVELMSKASGDEVSFEKLVTPNTGKSATYRFTKGTGAGATTMDIDIEKDQVRAIVGFVTITEGTGADAGKYFDGQTEVTAADGVTGAGIYLKSQELKDGTATGVYKYADASAVIEYLTVGTQTNKVVKLTIDPATHTITADIEDGAITKAKLASTVQASLDLADSSYQLPSGGIPATDLASAVQTSLGKADSALQSADLDEPSESELQTAWNEAMAAAETPAQSGD